MPGRSGRRGHPGADQAAAIRPRLGEHLAGQVGRRVERRPGVVVDLEHHVALGQHGGGKVGDGHAHVPVAEVDAERCADGGVEAKEHRRAAAARRARATGLLLGDHAAPLEVGDERRHGRARQPWRRASSLRLAVPWRRSASTTRSRLSSRRLPNVPGSTVMCGRASGARPTLSQDRGRISPAHPRNTPRPGRRETLAFQLLRPPAALPQPNQDA